MEDTNLTRSHNASPARSLPAKGSAEHVARPVARLDTRLQKRPGRMKRRVFERELEKLHVELVKLQLWVKHKGLRIIVVFEGRDAAGKGGVIRCLTERVSPRVFRVVALLTPTEREASQLHIQRYISQFPAAGEVVIFDRSWYNRAGVERVMGFCPESEVQRFLLLVPLMERVAVESGIIIIKYWFEVSRKEQARRFKARIDDGRKIWKLSPMDLESHRRWYDYSRARDEMLQATDTPFAPWYIVRADDKRRARLNCIGHLLTLIPYKAIRRPKVKIPKQQKRKGYLEPANRVYKIVPELF